MCIYETLRLFINAFIYVFNFITLLIHSVHIYIQSGYIIPSCTIPAIFPGRMADELANMRRISPQFIVNYDINN